MAVIDVFNGDADGLCSLVQLRRQTPEDSVIVTGVKRDIQLLERISASKGDRVTVLDISLDSNREPLSRLLHAGAYVAYFDHHHAGQIPFHRNLSAHIDTAPDVCTSLLVDRYLNGTQRLWAIVGAFGDNLNEVASNLASAAGLPDQSISLLKELGSVLNYNAYGEIIADLRYPPDELYPLLLESGSPFDFINSSSCFRILSDGLAQDLESAQKAEVIFLSNSGAVYCLPDTDWSRRVSGAFSNELACKYPERAHAVLTGHAGGDYVVSVRAPMHKPAGADDVCRQFPSGGGRKSAAGINSLPDDQLVMFLRAFKFQYP